MPIYFQLTQTPLPITLESLGNHWQQVSVQRPQGHHYFHWLQTESGRGELWIGEQRLILEPGQGILIAPFVPHAYYPLGEWQTNFATFDGELKDDFSKLLTTEAYLQAQDSAAFSFSDWINELVAAHESGRLEPLQLSSRCYEFFLNLRQGKPRLPQLPPAQRSYILSITHEIETNYSQITSMEDLAQKLYISPQYLNRIFRRHLGKSPYRYLTDFRLNKAKELLVNHPALPVQEIALRIGFQSPSQFIAMFKSKTGYTPKQFRKLHY